MLAIPTAARSVESIRASAVGFAVFDMVRTAPAVLRIFIHREKGVFQHNRREADIRQAADFS
jgi:hypothetical protein